MRIFAAIDLPDPVREVLEDLQDQLPVGRLMAPDTLHLTLAFFGEQPRDVVAEVHGVLEAVRAEPFAVKMHGLGVFGSKSPKVLWAGVAQNPALMRLRDRVRSAVRLAGLELPRERFRPHVTLARFGGRVEGHDLERVRGFLERYWAAPMPGFEVDRFALFQSRLRADRAEHELLAEYPLAATAIPPRT